MGSHSPHRLCHLDDFITDKDLISSRSKYFYFQIKIVKSRSTRCLSFPLTVTTFLASVSWTFYGLLLDDLYIAVSIWPGWGLN